MAENTSPSNEGSTKKQMDINEVDNIKSVYEENGWNINEAFMVCSLTSNVKQTDSEKVVDADPNEAYMINFVNVMNSSDVVVVPAGTINEKNEKQIAKKRKEAKEAKKAEKAKAAEEAKRAEAIGNDQK